jgi:hypothetical protein
MGSQARPAAWSHDVQGDDYYFFVFEFSILHSLHLDSRAKKGAARRSSWLQLRRRAYAHDGERAASRRKKQIKGGAQPKHPAILSHTSHQQPSQIMFGKILCLFVALAGIMGSSAFVPSTPLVRSRAAPGSSVVMSAKPQHAIAAATTALLTAAPAMAAEGTSLVSPVGMLFCGTRCS